MHCRIQLLCQTLRSASLVVKFLQFEQLSLEQLHLCKPRGRWPRLACHSSLWPERAVLSFIFLLMSNVLQSLEFFLLFIQCKGQKYNSSYVHLFPCCLQEVLFNIFLKKCQLKKRRVHTVITSNKCFLFPKVSDSTSMSVSRLFQVAWPQFWMCRHGAWLFTVKRKGRLSYSSPPT